MRALSTPTSGTIASQYRKPFLPSSDELSARVTRDNISRVTARRDLVREKMITAIEGANDIAALRSVLIAFLVMPEL